MVKLIKTVKLYLLLCSLYSADCLTANTSLMGQLLTFLASLQFFFARTRIETVLALVLQQSDLENRRIAHYVISPLLLTLKISKIILISS